MITARNRHFRRMKSRQGLRAPRPLGTFQVFPPRGTPRDERGSPKAAGAQWGSGARPSDRRT